uniref:Uncharacterized protein n=1 Tax=Tanacetum cinerariifolium TaxID=118510 RepID=A0A699H0B7_TANCI|nr:hypothetical protein [Tanacetum cinerariifolium]GEW85087.1 hypothetical protein [Tanacetum cinerariifolium]
MERFENAIFKQREVINDRMTEMFGLLKELLASRTPKKVLIREDARHLITKNVNSISVIQEEEEKDVVNNRAIIESIVEPSESEEEEPPKKASMMNKVERRLDDDPTKSLRENIMKKEEEEVAGASRIAKDILVDVTGYVYPMDFVILDIKVEKGIKNDIKPIAPTMTINRLVLEWEEKIKLHQEKQMKFDQWRSKNFRNKHLTLVEVKNKMVDEKEVT